MIDRKPYPVAIEKHCEELYDMLLPHVDELVVDEMEREIYENNPQLEYILEMYGIRHKLDVSEIFPDLYREKFLDMMRDSVQDAISIYF